MKSIIFFVATIATVLAAPYYPALQVYSNGAVAPVETPEVQHEKAKHFAAHAERSHGYGPVHVAAYAAPHAYGYHVPVIHNGVPVDTPEVQHAKAAHFAAYAKAAHGLPVHAHTYAAGHYHVPVIHNGVPVDTPEVQHAKAAHFAAYAKAAHAPAPVHHVGGHYHVPLTHNGVPVDTPEVQHAKAAHFAAVAKAGGHAHGHAHYDHGHYDHAPYYGDDGSYKADHNGY